MKIEGILYGFGIVLIIFAFWNFIQINDGASGIVEGSFTVLLNSLVSPLILIGLGKLLLMMRHYGEQLVKKEELPETKKENESND